MWQRARQKLLKSPTAVARAHPRPRRVQAGPALLVQAGPALLVLAGLAAEVMEAEAMEVAASAPMAAEGSVEDAGAVSAGRGVNGPAKARLSLWAPMARARS